MTGKIRDGLLYVLIYLASLITAMLLVGITAYVFIKGSGFLRWAFLTSVTSVTKGIDGRAGNIVNT